jgi:hypothetical protein
MCRDGIQEGYASTSEAEGNLGLHPSSGSLDCLLFVGNKSSIQGEPAFRMIS